MNDLDTSRIFSTGVYCVLGILGLGCTPKYSHGMEQRDRCSIVPPPTVEDTARQPRMDQLHRLSCEPPEYADSFGTHNDYKNTFRGRPQAASPGTQNFFNPHVSDYPKPEGSLCPGYPKPADGLCVRQPATGDCSGQISLTD